MHLPRVSECLDGTSMEIDYKLVVLLIAFVIFVILSIIAYTTYWWRYRRRFQQDRSTDNVDVCDTHILLFHSFIHIHTYCKIGYVFYRDVY